MDISSKKIFPQPLTEPLAKKVGSINITPEWLLTLPFNQETTPSIHWLDEENLIIGKQSSIERINTKTGQRKILAEGSNPKPSPNGKFIIFVKEENKIKQLIFNE